MKKVIVLVRYVAYLDDIKAPESENIQESFEFLDDVYVSSEDGDIIFEKKDVIEAFDTLSIVADKMHYLSIC
jgi:hypothetical protein